MIAAALALLAGACFALSSFIQRAGLSYVDMRLGIAISIGTMTALGWLAAPWLLQPAWWSSHAVWIFAACGLLFPALSQSMQVLSVSKVGPTLTSALGSVAPVFAIVPAVFVLGESVNAQGLAGLALVLCGLILSAFAGQSRAAQGVAITALAIPLIASAARGIVQPAAKYGLAEVPSPYFATLVMVSVSTLVVSTRLMGNTSARRVGHAKGPALFALNGAVTGLGILSLNLAIDLGSVTLAAPLASTVPLWALLFGWLFFRGETIGPRQVVLAVLVVVGVGLIVTR